MDLSANNIDMPINEFYQYILIHLKKLSKLEFLSFYGNPIENKIQEFKYFIINELPKLKYYNWDLITKEDRIKSHKLESEGLWDNHLLPISNLDFVKPIYDNTLKNILSDFGNSINEKQNFSGI